MKKVFLALLVLLSTNAVAQQAVEKKQQNLSRWNIGTGHYSGITALGENRYAVVSDKEPQDGFFLFEILQNEETGEITDVSLEAFKGNPNPTLNNKGISTRDTEGIAYLPHTNTLLISGEGDQAILEYAMDGTLTGRRVVVPNLYAKDNIVSNYGFEALTYGVNTQTLWTVTESMLKSDGVPAGPKNAKGQNSLRMQCFDQDLQPIGQYAYRMDRGMDFDFGMTYAFGVPALCALPDGRLLVLEREANVSNGYLSSHVRCKLFIVNPNDEEQIDSTTDFNSFDPNKFMTKTLIADFTTKLNPFVHTWANYEGMCLGRKLSDGRQTIILINDSQGNFGIGPLRLKDYLKVFVLGE